MKYQKQVDKSHYEFKNYMSKERWASVWHQLDEIQKINPKNVLEIGPGLGLFKKLAATFNINVETLDIDPDLDPDHLSPITEMPFKDNSYDVVCAYQMLEHLPYETAIQAFKEMVRVCKKNLVISLPDAQLIWRYQIYIPKLGTKDFLIARPRFKTPVHNFDGEHYWEINKRDYPLTKILTDFTVNINLLNTYRVKENPYHRFFIFEKKVS